jgi:hypothetical protein
MLSLAAWVLVPGSSLAQAADPCSTYGGTIPDYIIGEDQCDIEYASVVFPMDQEIVEKKIVINGTFVIDKLINFLDCIIEMGPEAEIYVTNNNGLTIAGCTIYSCSNLWRAIRVGGGGYLGLWEGDQNGRNHIQDAKAAVFAHNGSTVTVTGTDFVNNVIGFYIPPTVAQPLPITNYNVVTLHQFRDLTFECNGSLLQVSSTYCAPHIEVQEVQNLIAISPGTTCFSGVLIHDVRMLQLSSTHVGADNLYKNLQNGIVAHYSDVFVQYSRFENIPVNNFTGHPIVGYGIYANGYGEILDQQGYGFSGTASFSNVRFPVRAMMLSRVRSFANNIVNANEAYRVENCKEGFIHLYDNKIQAIRSGITLFHNDPTYEMIIENNEISVTGSTNVFNNNGAWVGIQIDEMKQKHANTALIQQNIIHAGNSFRGGIHAINTRHVNIEQNIVNLESDVSIAGIGMINGFRNIVRENMIRGSDTGHSNFFEPANFGLRTFNDVANRILCNEYENLRIGHGVVNNCGSTIIGRNVFNGPFQVGLWYDRYGITGHQSNTMNTWPGNAAIGGGFEAQHLGSQMVIWQSIFEVHSNVTDGMPDPIDPEEDWFFENDSHDTFEECHVFSHFTPLPDPGVLEERIAIDSMFIPEDAPAYAWNMRYYLYAYLKQWPSGTWDTTIYEDFLDTHATSSIGTWHDLEEAIHASFFTDSTTIAQKQSYLDTVYSAMEQLNMYRYMLDTANSSTDSLIAISGISDVMSGMNIYIENVQSQQYLADSLRKENWNDLLASLSIASASDDWTQALQSVWSMYLLWLLDDESNLDSLTLANLADIAAQCAHTHGHAVYLAGSLISVRQDVHFTYACPESEELVSYKDNAPLGHFAFKLSPNPAKDELQIQLLSDQLHGELLLVDMHGRELQRKAVNSPVMHINLQSLQSGLYAVIWLQPNQPSVSRPLVISR